MFTEEGIIEFKSLQQKRVFIICLLMILPFLIAPYFVKEWQVEEYYIALIMIVLIMIITSFFMRNIFTNTTIEIFDIEIKRFGKGLSEVMIKYSDIKKITERKDGVVIYKKGAYKKVFLLNDRTALTNRKDVMFIPKGIENYERILKFLKSKI